MAKIECMMCHADFEGRKRRKFCSRSCSNTYTNLFFKKYDGEHNSNWKGGVDKLQLSRIWIKEHPEANRAKATVHRALVSGHLCQDVCVVCSSTSNTEAHHQDYSRPLTVDWLCHKCHRLIHSAVSELKNIAC